MLKIRPFEKTAEEYDLVVNLVNAVWPDHAETVEEWQHYEESRPSDAFYKEIVAELDGVAIAYAFYCKPWWWTATEPGQFFFEMFVHPDHQSGGMGKAIYQFILEDLACEEPKQMMTKSREDQATMLGLFGDLGFEQTMRYPMSRLDMAEFDASPYLGLLDKLPQKGVSIQSLTQLRESSDSDWKHKLYELRWAIIQDVPNPEPPKKQPFETFEKLFFNHPKLLPDANFIAMDGDEFVGFSNLWPVTGINKLNTGLTGVVRSHRRKGLATALKVKGFEYAIASGIELIETENEENNPMYDLNMQLGFKPCPAWLDFKKMVDVPVPCANESQAATSADERIA